MELNTIRSIIFLTAALILLIFPTPVIKMQSKVLTFLKIKHSKSKGEMRILGIIFLIIALILYLIN
ncbi:hypothetical protein HOD05_05165 [Candidatus Woesearchaeota archaeon]|nr:hypothetical protein [Candidatus Woesearchaeota archaeon]MBT4151102.1 hypothetical protein [Candidatus Woesearchaeota archaeon]MBT4434576.1 hypothetical protein [Candidatus Woesearchaeota archaeon]MBT7332221.1 hypothetical protein [Candidatus Woesearchaeota archaeon]